MTAKLTLLAIKLATTRAWTGLVLLCIVAPAFAARGQLSAHHAAFIPRHPLLLRKKKHWLLLLRAFLIYRTIEPIFCSPKLPN